MINYKIIIDPIGHIPYKDDMQTQILFQYVAIDRTLGLRPMQGRVEMAVDPEVLDSEDAEQILGAMIEDYCGVESVAYVYELMT